MTILFNISTVVLKSPGFAFGRIGFLQKLFYFLL